MNNEEANGLISLIVLLICLFWMINTCTGINNISNELKELNNNLEKIMWNSKAYKIT